MLRTVAAITGVIALTATTIVQAAPPDAAAQSEARKRCDKSNDDVQDIRDQATRGSDLLQGLDYTKECLADVCNEATRKNCEENRVWLEREIPNVIFTASKDGDAIVPESIVVDDKPADRAGDLWKADGRKYRINPGRHVIVFTFGGVQHRIERIVAQQSTQTLEAIFPSSTPPAAAPVAESPVPAIAPAQPPAPDTAPSPPPATSSPLRTLGWIGVGAGAVGVVVGSVFGLKMFSDKSDATCNAANMCKPGPLDDARSAAHAANAGFIVGGLLLAGGVAMLLAAPSSSSTSTPAPAARKRITVLPTVGKNEGSVVLQGAW